MTIEERIVKLHRNAHNLAFACYIRKGFVPSPLPEIVEATTSLKAFLKYSPDQPRVPAGNPGGGEWTSGDGGDGASDNNAEASSAPVTPNKDILPKISVPAPSGQPVNQANIFVGGAGDQTFGRNVADSTSLNKNVYGDNYYATFDQRDEIDKQIAQ